MQPLVLLFEDIHWAEEPLLDLIEHLADWVACAASDRLPRATRAARRRARAGAEAACARRRSSSSRSRRRRAPSSSDAPRPARRRVRRATSVRSRRRRSTGPRATRCSSRRPSGCSWRAVSGTARRIVCRTRCRRSSPHASTVCAPDAKTLLQRGSVVGRVFWRGRARASGAGRRRDHDALLDDLLQREFLLREPRSSISGETAYRFKHALIREVAYTGLAKLARAQYHARFAEWLAERTGEELIEIRAYHLDRSVEFLTELEGAAPEELAHETAAALVKAAKRAIAREAYANARTLGSARARAAADASSARYVAARAAWRLQDWTAVQLEMDEGARAGARRGRARDRGAGADRAGRGVAQARRRRRRARRTLVDEALEILGRERDPVAHFDALSVRAMVGAWLGSEEDYVRYMERAYAIALDARPEGSADDRRPGACDRRASIAARARRGGAPDHARARARRGERERPRARLSATLAYGWFLRLKGELDAAETMIEEVREHSPRSSACEPVIAAALMQPGLDRASQRATSAVREDVPRGGAHHERPSAIAGSLPDYQRRARDDARRARQGRGGRAARARRARRCRPRGHELPGLRRRPRSPSVRAAQGRDDEAEELFRLGDRRSPGVRPQLFELPSARAPGGVPRRRAAASDEAGRLRGAARGAAPAATSRAPRGSPDSTPRRATRRSRSRAARSRRARRGAAPRGAFPRRTAGASSRCGSRRRCPRSGCGTARRARARRPRARAPRGTASARGTRRRSSRACARSRAPGAPSRRGARSRRRRPPSRGRARGPSPRCRTATPRSFASSRSRSVAELLDDGVDRVLAAASEEEARDGRRRARRRSRPRCPALRSRAPTADVNFRPLASRWPMNPNSGAWTESATSCSRASSPRRSANG